MLVETPTEALLPKAVGVNGDSVRLVQVKRLDERSAIVGDREARTAVDLHRIGVSGDVARMVGEARRFDRRDAERARAFGQGDASRQFQADKDEERDEEHVAV